MDSHQIGKADRNTCERKPDKQCNQKWEQDREEAVGRDRQKEECRDTTQDNDAKEGPQSWEQHQLQRAHIHPTSVCIERCVYGGVCVCMQECV